MENASKALLIAGAMLILMLVLTVGIYFTRRMSYQTSEIYKTLEQSDIDKFNQKFFVYEGRDIYIQDVASIIYLAKNINEEQKVPTTVNVVIPENVLDEIEIKYIDNDNVERTISNGQAALNAEIYLKTDDINKMISLHLEDSYLCELTFDNESQYVNKITIKNKE